MFNRHQVLHVCLGHLFASLEKVPNRVDRPSEACDGHRLFRLFWGGVEFTTIPVASVEPFPRGGVLGFARDDKQVPAVEKPHGVELGIIADELESWAALTRGSPRRHIEVCLCRVLPSKATTQLLGL